MPNSQKEVAILECEKVTFPINEKGDMGEDYFCRDLRTNESKHLTPEKVVEGLINDFNAAFDIVEKTSFGLPLSRKLAEDMLMRYAHHHRHPYHGSTSRIIYCAFEKYKKGIADEHPLYSCLIETEERELKERIRIIMCDALFEMCNDEPYSVCEYVDSDEVKSKILNSATIVFEGHQRWGYLNGELKCKPKNELGEELCGILEKHIITDLSFEFTDDEEEMIKNLTKKVAVEIAAEKINKATSIQQ